MRKPYIQIIVSETHDSSRHFLHTKAKLFRKILTSAYKINLDNLFNLFFLFQPFIKCWPTGNQSFASWWRPRPNSWWRFSKDAQRMGKPYWFSSSNGFFFLIIFKDKLKTIFSCMFLLSQYFFPIWILIVLIY